MRLVETEIHDGLPAQRPWILHRKTAGHAMGEPSQATQDILPCLRTRPARMINSTASSKSRSETAIQTNLDNRPSVSYSCALLKNKISSCPCQKNKAQNASLRQRPTGGVRPKK
jgi:hypothetical protein